MKNEITIIDSKDFGLTEDKAIQITQSFLPKIAEFNGYIEVYNLIITEDITEETISKANSLRKKLVKVRTGIADVHKAEKAFYLASGKYIDALKNKHTLPVLQMEEKLEEIEKDKIRSLPTQLCWMTAPHKEHDFTFVRGAFPEGRHCPGIT